MQDLPNGGGGRRSKHWPPGAGDPRYATAATVWLYVCVCIHGCMVVWPNVSSHRIR